jgi:pilus assembly protein CpaE
MKPGVSWKFLFVCPNPAISGALVPVLGSLAPTAGLLEVPVYPPSHSLAELISTHTPNACFLDMTSDRDKGLAALAEIHSIQPKLNVIALLGDNDPDLILRCLRGGASEFLIRPFMPDQVAEALERIAKKLGAEVAANAGKVYCLTPAKGACGATMISSNLAFQLKRLGAKRVLLADLDPLTGTMSFSLKLKTNYSFLDAVQHKSGLDPDIWKALIVQSQGVDILLSPESVVDGIHEIADPGPLIEFVRSQYDAVVIDSGGVYGSWGLSLARLADELLMVSTNELPALQATQRAFTYLDTQRVDREKVRLLVNRYNRDVGLSREVIETALHEEVYHVLPSDYDAVQRALIDGRPVPANSNLGKSLGELGERLYGKKAEPEKKSAGSAWSGLLNLFTRTKS